MAYVSSRTTGCVRITTVEGYTCLLVSAYAAGNVDILGHGNVAPNSIYTTSVHNEFVMFPGSQLNIHKELSWLSPTKGNHYRQSISYTATHCSE